MGSVNGDWINDAHRGMELRPTKECVRKKILRNRTYLFQKWSRDDVHFVIVQLKGSKKRFTIHHSNLTPCQSS